MKRETFSPDLLEEDGELEEPSEHETIHLRPDELFCRFTPTRIDEMATYWLGEPPLCERWISCDGKQAILRTLNFKFSEIARKQSGESEQKQEITRDLVALWNERFQRKRK